jgi:hypothetical protein
MDYVTYYTWRGESKGTTEENYRISVLFVLSILLEYLSLLDGKGDSAEFHPNIWTMM